MTTKFKGPAKSYPRWKVLNKLNAKKQECEEIVLMLLAKKGMIKF